MTLREQLARDGYVVIPGVLDQTQIETARGYFDEWYSQNTQVRDLHKKIDPHGIFKFAEVGHQKMAWYIRGLESVQRPFREIWGTDDLVVSFDGSCYMTRDEKHRDTNWTHTDQAPGKKGLHCVQGFVALTSNSERTLRVYYGSHLLHEGVLMNSDKKKDWVRIDEGWLKDHEGLKRVLTVPAGSLVLWDSRCFHQNQYGNVGEERLVQYVCYLPRNAPGNTKKMQEKRRLYLETRRTTSHWPYPLHVNGLQPQTYGDITRTIDYEGLFRQDLTEFQGVIDNLV
jgi:ectoine hydroxylase-related dioxygenase (phytanoyl-CoA dioxygenase family)